MPLPRDRKSIHPKRFASLLGIVLLITQCIVLTSVLHAQIDRAVLVGTVTDPSGSVIAGASIRITAVATDITQERTTNSSGYYRFPGLAVGNYTVTASNTGFRTAIVSGVVLEVDQTRTLDIKLTVGAVSEKVEVNATTEPVNRTSAEAGTVIRPDQIADLA